MHGPISHKESLALFKEFEGVLFLKRDDAFGSVIAFDHPFHKI